MKQLLQKLLWQNKSRWQLIVALLGTFWGLFLVLASLQIYFDIQQILHGDKSDSEQYIIINKKVNIFNSLGVKSTFSEEEIESIQAQYFVEQVGTFEPNLFKVSASSSVLGFYTELFFEAVDDAFIDVENSDFSWREGQEELPVILSKDYLALYNFGFAPSQGLPQFTPSTIGRVSLDVNIGGRNSGVVFQGRVVGFSERINSILVPMNFMKWANQNYGNSASKGKSRLILKTKQANSELVKNFLSDNGYELSGGRIISSQASTMLNLLIGVILLIGLIIFILSIIVFVLNYQLFVAQSQEDIRLLLQLGHRSDSIIKLLFNRLILFFGIIVLTTLASLYLFHTWLKNWVSNQGFEMNNSIHPFVFLATLLIIALFLIINFQTIKKSVKALL